MANGENITKIYGAVLNRVNKICNKSEIALIIKEYNKKFNSKVDIERAIKYLSRHNYIKRIFLSFYYINSLDERKRGYCKYEDKELLFLVLSKINLKWYLGLSSALYESGKAWQIPIVISIINDRFSGKRRIMGLKVKFYKVKEKLIIGTKKNTTKNKAEYFYSVPSKTYLDIVYLRVSNKLVRDKDTKKYIKYFPKWVEKR
jgi:predicted transcriptional regulator of viral defense system